MVAVAALAVLTVACGGATDEEPSAPPGAIRIAAFNFPESELIAEIYAQALEARGFPVERLGRIGSREVAQPPQRPTSINQALPSTRYSLRGIETRSRMEVALCGASNERWTATVRRRCSARASAPARDYRVGAQPRSSDQMCLIETGGCVATVVVANLGGPGAGPVPSVRLCVTGHMKRLGSSTVATLGRTVWRVR